MLCDSVSLIWLSLLTETIDTLVQCAGSLVNSDGFLAFHSILTRIYNGGLWEKIFWDPNG